MGPVLVLIMIDEYYQKWLDNDKEVQILPHTPRALTIFLDTKILICQLLGPDLGGVWESTHKIGELAIF